MFVKYREKVTTLQKNLKNKKTQSDKRNLVSGFFVVLLIGLAYQEMVAPVREEIRFSGITINTIALASVFFVVSIRFFIGNQLHLFSDSFAKLPGWLWLYDLLFIISQCIVLVFMGGDSTVALNQHARIDYIDLLLCLYVIDVIWIVTQWFLGLIVPKWKRTFLPWGWCLLNSGLIISIILLKVFISDIYSEAGLLWLLGFNLIAFVVDVMLVDYYDAI